MESNFIRRLRNFWNKKTYEIRFGSKADQFFNVDAKLWDAFVAKCKRMKKDPLKVLPELIEKGLKKENMVFESQVEFRKKNKEYFDWKNHGEDCNCRLCGWNKKKRRKNG